MSAGWSMETSQLEWFHTGSGLKFLYKKFGREQKAVQRRDKIGNAWHMERCRKVLGQKKEYGEGVGGRE